MAFDGGSKSVGVQEASLIHKPETGFERGEVGENHRRSVGLIGEGAIQPTLANLVKSSVMATG